MTAAFLARVTAELERARSSDLLRTLETRLGPQRARIEIDGRHLVNFTSNDYLGLAAHPRVLARVAAELPKQGFGAGAAALLSGRSSLHESLERELADFTGTEAGLMFSSGYLANTGALPALIGREDFVAHDRLNHASLIDGVLTSGARHRRYAHADVDAAANLLGTNCTGHKFLITESVFSMDGDCAPLSALATRATAHGAVLYVDDAHGFGVTGGGRGAAASLDSGAVTTLTMITLGKALGSVGAVILGPANIIELLTQRARTFIYDTALPAVCAAAALEALDCLRSDDGPRRQLADNLALFRRAAETAGLRVMPSTTPIQAVPIGNDRRALEIAAALVAAGFYVRAIRPPTVPKGTARLRITITAGHTATDINALVHTLAEVLPT